MPSIDIPATSGVYRILNTIDGKFYLGSSVNLHTRWRQHRNELRHNKHTNKKLQNAWNKHTESAFVFEIVELILPPFLLEREQYWLDKYKPWGRKGYNLARDAQSPGLGLKRSPETIARMSKANLGNTRNLGKKRSPVSIEKTRLAHLGMKRSPEACANMSAAQFGKKMSPETCTRMSAAKKGKPRSLPIGTETRAKMSAAKKGKAPPNLGKKHTPQTIAKIGTANEKVTLIVTDPSGMEHIIHGVAKFCREHRLDQGALTKVAQGKAKQHKGWTARYAEPDAS